MERNCFIDFFLYLLINKAISTSECTNTVPILCEENLPGHKECVRIVMHKIRVNRSDIFPQNY